jgi:hypothetical protein
VTQIVAVVSLGVLLAAAALFCRDWKMRRDKHRHGNSSSLAVGDIFRKVNSKPLPVEGFEDWKVHYLRLLVSARPPTRWWISSLGPDG